MVTGGAEGLILSIDPHALGVTNQVDAHKGKDILNVFLFDEQQQIISVCEDRSVCLWDAFRLDKLQTIKDQEEDIHVPKFSSASFDSIEGVLYVGD
jgi:WD40 repeat protein